MRATTYVPVGSGTEVGFLKFLQDAEVPVHLLIQRKLGKIQGVSPFSPIKKRSAVALVHPDRTDKVVVYVKGAPEIVIPMCKTYLTASGEQEDFNEDDQNGVLAHVDGMAGRPLRVLSFAYAEMDLADWEERVGSSTPDRALEDALINDNIELTFVSVFGLKDPLRPKVTSCVKYARDSGKMGVRLVSGDHVSTAKAVALKAGILSQGDLDSEYAVMDAADFRQ